MVKKNTIPDGWRNVSPVGQPIPGTRFIAFKVPLKGAINHRLTPTQKFTPKDLIAAVKAFNAELGLIIDLTYTTRYYDIKDLPKNMEYKKLFTVGLEVPDDPTILQFKKRVRKFLWENANNEKLIGVHSTNGINRTGYLICRYLIDVEGWDPETAIQAFGEARGHHMDGHIYLTDLKTQPMRSNLGMNMWDADGDILPPPDDTDGHMNRFSNEEYSRSKKMFIKGKQGERQRPFYNQQSSDDFQSSLQDQNQSFLNKRCVERLRLFQNCSVRDDAHSPVGDFEYVTRGCGQRMVPFLDQQYHSELQRKLSLEDFDDEDSNRRSRHLDYQSYCDFSEKSQLKNFQNKAPEQRLNYFNDHSTHINEPYEEYSERSYHFTSREYYAESTLLQRGYGSDKDNYTRTCRKIHPSEGINRGRKARFVRYSSYSTLHSSSSHQELTSTSLCSGREHQCEIKREMIQGKRLPVVTIDYNYGLPLDYASEEEDRAHYDSHATEYYNMK